MGSPLSLSLFLPVSLSVSLSIYLSLPPSIPPSLPLSLSLSLSLTLSLSISLSFHVSRICSLLRLVVQNLVSLLDKDVVGYIGNVRVRHILCQIHTKRK